MRGPLRKDKHMCYELRIMIIPIVCLEKEIRICLYEVVLHLLGGW